MIGLAVGGKLVGRDLLEQGKSWYCSGINPLIPSALTICLSRARLMSYRDISKICKEP